MGTSRGSAGSFTRELIRSISTEAKDLELDQENKILVPIRIGAFHLSGNNCPLYEEIKQSHTEQRRVQRRNAGRKAAHDRYERKSDRAGQDGKTKAKRINNEDRREHRAR